MFNLREKNVYLLENKRKLERDIQRESLDPPDHSPNGHKNQSWAKLKPGAGPSLLVFHEDGDPSA